MIVLEVMYQGRTKKVSTDREMLTIGQGRSCALKISDPGVGQNHCTLKAELVKRPRRRGKKWMLQLRDHQVSDVPTLVNGIEVIKSYLNRGDTIRIGGMHIKVVDVGAQASKPGMQSTTPPIWNEAVPEHAGLTAKEPVPSPPPLEASRPTPLPPGETGSMQPSLRHGTTRRSRPVDPDQASPQANRILGWLVAGMAAAILVLVVLITQGTGNQGTKAGKSGSLASRDRDSRSKDSSDRFNNNPDASLTPGQGNRPLWEIRQNSGNSGAELSSNEEAIKFPDPTALGAGPRPGKATPAKVDSHRRKAPGETLSKREIYLEALKADRLSRENDFAAAAEVYRDLVLRTPFNRLAAEMKDRVVDLERLAAARKNIEAKLADPNEEKPEILSRGSALKVLGGQHGKGVLVDLNGQVLLPWNHVSVRGMESLLRWAYPGAEGQLLRGIYLFEFKADFEKNPVLEERCHSCFQLVLKQNPGRIQEVNTILGRGLGVKSPTGFVYHNRRFMTPERRDRLMALAEARKQLGNLRSAKAEIRRKAYDFLRSVPDLEMYQLFRRVMEAQRRTLAHQLLASPVGKKLLSLREKKQKFLAMRQEMLAAIFDTVEYPYPFLPSRGASQEDYQRYLVSQKKIDAGVKELEKIWDSGKGQFTLAKPFLERYSLLEEVQVELEKFKADEVEPTEGIEGLTVLIALGDPSFFKKTTRGKITLATLPMDRKERFLLEYNHRVMKYNAALKSSATKTEKKQVLVTNLYRHLMGRKALMLHNKLLASARGHSRDMVLKGYFSHTAPDPERRTPRLRMKLAGYELTGGSENIARGASGPEAVHIRWFHSSGHHRNILNKGWLEMGSGNVGRYWTQNFGTRGKNLYELLGEQQGKEKASKRTKKKPMFLR